MANHVLNTRVQLKYDTYQNWYDNNPVLLSGEVAIATVPNAANEGANFTNLPNVVIKVGDGTTAYRTLPFLSALAADVHSWAKNPEKPVYSASEITGLDQFIAGEIQDTDTTYEIKTIDASTYKLGLYSWPKGTAHTTAGTLVSTIDLSAIDTRLDGIDAKLAGVDGTVAAAIEAAVGALDMAEVAAGATERIVSVKQADGLVTVTKGDMNIENVAGLQSALDSKQGNLTFTGTPSTTNKVVTTDTMAADILSAVQALDKADTAVANQFVTEVSEADGIITVKRAQPTIANVSGLQAALNAKQDTVAFEDGYNAESNKAATVATVTRMVADLNGAMHFEGVVQKDPTTNSAAENASYSAGDVVLFGVNEYVYDGAAWHVLGNESIYKLKDEANLEHEAMAADIEALEANKQDNLAFEGTYNASDNKVVTKSALDAATAAATQALDYNGGSFGAHKFATKVTEADGIIAVEYAQPEIANISGLETRLTGIDEAIASKQDALGFEGTYNKTSNKVVTKSALTDAIGALDKADTEVAHQFVSAVSQADGVITVSRKQITTDDIAQGVDVLVFNCGSATENI